MAHAARDAAGSGAVPDDRTSASRADASSAKSQASDGSAAEVWIGQLWSQTPALCDPDASAIDSDFVFDPAGNYQRVALILETDAQGQLSGRIRLGEGMAPASPGVTKFDDGSEAWQCGPTSLTTGVEYTVLDAKRTPNRLLFHVVPNEAWVNWCATQTAASLVCWCRRDKCSANLKGRLPLDLAITADSMEGDVFDASFGAIAQLRLRRVQ